MSNPQQMSVEGAQTIITNSQTENFFPVTHAICLFLRLCNMVMAIYPGSSEKLLLGEIRVQYMHTAL